MKKTCPKCEAEEIQSFKSAHYIGEGKSAFKEKEPSRYECKKCGWSWRDK